MAVRLILGHDQVLVGDALSRTVDELVGDGDRSGMLEMLSEDDYRRDDGGWDAARLSDAARTPPLLSDRRVVVGRHLSRFSRKDDYSPIVELLGDLLPTTDLVLVWEPGVDPRAERLPRLPKAIEDAARLAGAAVLRAEAPVRAADGRNWLHDQLASSSLDFDRSAAAAVEDLLGEDRNRVVGLLRTLEGALGSGAKVTAADIEQHGGEAGTIVPWALEDAIDSGSVSAALSLLPRLVPYGGTTADRSNAVFRLVGLLHRRYANMLRLDGSGVRSERSAAELLGMKGSSFPAKKAMQQASRLGGDKIGRAIELLADADLSLRGTKDWPPELVAELLVARLANLSRRR